MKCRGIHAFSSASGNDQILLVDQPFLDLLSYVMATMPIGVGLPDASFNEVIPAEKFLPPKLERIEQCKICTVCQS